MGTTIVCVILGVLVFFAVKSLCKNHAAVKKGGCAGCGCCGGCSGCGDNCGNHGEKNK